MRVPEGTPCASAEGQGMIGVGGRNLEGVPIQRSRRVGSATKKSGGYLRNKVSAQSHHLCVRPSPDGSLWNQ